jgi:hypothetical protein
MCLPKEEGGLGVRSITEKNTSLLVKLLHCTSGESWPHWVWESQAGMPLDMIGNVRHSLVLPPVHPPALQKLLKREARGR